MSPDQVSSNNLLLYGSTNSGHSYKPRLLMLMSDVPHAYEHVEIFIPLSERQEEFQKVARFGEVPVLIDGDQVLVQSNAILLHLAKKHKIFGAHDNAGWDEITSWLFWEANRIGRSYPNLRYSLKFDKTADKGVVAWFQKTATEDLDRLNKELENKDFLLGEMTIADISCAAYLLYQDVDTIKTEDWPNVEKWLDRIRSTSGWQHPLDVMV